jgi:hydroxymethylpyrimidine pyrophosphatase-like HAD family hydrolase
MGNAPVEIMDLAAAVTDTNENHGVGNAIYNLLLKE